MRANSHDLVPASARKAIEAEVRTGRQTIGRVGFRRETEEGGEFLILPECWKLEVCKGLDSHSSRRRALRSRIS
jgi:hypothetical protein